MQCPRTPQCEDQFADRTGFFEIGEEFVGHHALGHTVERGTHDDVAQARFFVAFKAGGRERALGGHQEARPHRDTLGTEGERCDQAASVAKSARGNDRNIDEVGAC